MSERVGAPGSKRGLALDEAVHSRRARPLWFGPSERPLFGWYHAPHGARARAAVVLCTSYGHEAMSTHRGHLNIASRLASEGFAVLRFDYDGTGDSAGGLEDPERVSAWLESIRAARAQVVELSGARFTALVGFRIGAWLALMAAVRDPVDALILFAPPRSGRAWVRELLALQALNEARLSRGGAAPELAVAGFPLDQATRAGLEALDASQLTRAPAARALIIARDDLPSGEASLVRKLRELGTETELSDASGYSAFMQEDPIKSRLPERVVDAAVAFLVDGSADSPPDSAPAVDSRRAAPIALPAPGVREEAVEFHGLFGILSQPLEPRLRVPTGVALFNIGANHHVGSNRMYVAMARRLAATGFSVLRLDFSGIGDSPIAPGGRENEVYAQRLFPEAKRAIDFLQSRGAEPVVLGGLCSGAYAAYHTAIADPRVSDVILINLLTYHWRDGDSLEVRTRNAARSTLFYKRAVWQLETWKRVVQGEVNVRTIARALAERGKRRAQRELLALQAKLTHTLAEATNVESAFKMLDRRGARAFLIFGADDSGIDAVEEQLGANASAMRGRPGFRMEILDGPDHTFTPLWTQQRLSDLIAEFLSERHAKPRPTELDA